LTIKAYINFKATHEDWSEYKLEDGEILRGRFVLIKVLDEGLYDEHGTPVYGINSTNAVGILVPEKLRGEPSEKIYDRTELEKSTVKEDVKFEIIKEGWNTYELENGAKISIKLVLASISRTDKFDSKGEPIYIFNMQPVMKGKIPDELRKKEEKRTE
jgi:hypothetical protein